MDETVADKIFEKRLGLKIGQAQEKSEAEKEIEQALADNSLDAARRVLRVRRFKQSLALIVIALLGYGIYWLFMPYKGGMAYGLCKVFLELNIRYPQTIRYSTVEEFDSSVRIWYTQVDSFGEYRLEPIQCFFKPDDQYGSVFEKVTINRRLVDQEIVDDFNKTLPILFAYPPDLTAPTPLPDSLKDLQIQTDLFRKPIL